MAYSYEQLRSLPDEDLIRFHDEMAPPTQVDVSYALDELARRDTEGQTAKLLDYTNQIRKLRSPSLPSPSSTSSSPSRSCSSEVGLFGDPGSGPPHPVLHLADHPLDRRDDSHRLLIAGIRKRGVHAADAL